MPTEYQTDGDLGFVGLNSRDNPAILPEGYLSKSVNFRLERGVARTRKGLKKYSQTSIYGPGKSVVGTGMMLDQLGQEIIILLVNDESETPNVTKLHQFNTATGSFSGAGITLPVVISSSEGVEIVQAIDNVFISRGHGNRPLKWDMTATPPAELPSNKEFPDCAGILYYQNRLIAKGKHLNITDINRRRDSICVSHYLQYDKWPALDCFTINQGGNDEVVALVPWTMNEFLVLCRNSAFYLNVGTNRYALGSALSNDARLESLSVDVGCAAKGSAIQVGGAVMFLSDNGVYVLQPTQSGQPDGVKLLTLSDPLSAPIDDVIQSINKDKMQNAVAAYWENRYYLAVPIGNSTKNNAVLVYNFILKAWESVDTFGDLDIDIFAFAVGKRALKRRLFFVDRKEGIMLSEETEGDEHGDPTGTPMLNFTPTTGPFAGLTGAYVPFVLSEGTFSGYPIVGEIVTRRFTAKEGKDKRFSSIETDFDLPAGGIVSTFAITNNPDSEVKIDEFASAEAEDATRRNPVRRIAYGMQVKFQTSNLQPTVRSNFIKFTINGKNNANTK